jgi:hypothetical protein
VTAFDRRGFFWRRHSGDGIKKSRRGGMPGLTNLRQGSGVTPDSGNTVLRSGVGRSYRQLPVRERVRREAASCRNRLLIKRYSRSGIGYRRCDFFFEPEYPCGGYFECTSLRLQSLSFRFFNHIKCNLRSRKRPKPGEVLAGAGTHGSTPCKYAVRCVISASEGHERASPLVHEIMSVVLGFASSDEIVFVGLGFGAVFVVLGFGAAEQP